MERITTAGIAEKNGTYFIALRKPGSSIGRKWEFPGGKKRDEESPEDALKREFFEEFSLNISVGDLICSAPFNNRDSKYMLQAYKIEILTGEIILKEHEEWKWADLDTIKSLDFAPSDKIILSCLETL